MAVNTESFRCFRFLLFDRRRSGTWIRTSALAPALVLGSGAEKSKGGVWGSASRTWVTLVVLRRPPNLPFLTGRISHVLAFPRLDPELEASTSSSRMNREDVIPLLDFLRDPWELCKGRLLMGVGELRGDGGRGEERNYVINIGRSERLAEPSRTSIELRR